MWKWLLFLLFCAFAALEAWVLLSVGAYIGIGWTLAWLFVSAAVGVLMVRVGGLAAAVRIHRKLQAQELPTRELVDMVLVLMGGVMLILPGFVSDAMGLALLVPAVRWLVRGVLWTLFGHLIVETEVPRARGSDDVIEIRPLQ